MEPETSSLVLFVCLGGGRVFGICGRHESGSLQYPSLHEAQLVAVRALKAPPFSHKGYNSLVPWISDFGTV